MNATVSLAIAITAEIIATSALKASGDLSRPLPSAIVVIGYGAAFYFLSIALKNIPLGTAYAIWSGAGIAIVSLIGWLFFKQSLDLAAIAGIGLILTGLVILNFFSKSAVH